MAERAQPAGFPVTIPGSYGDGVVISVSDGRRRISFTNGVCVSLGPAGREAFDQAWFAAGREADRQAVSSDG